MKKRILSLVLAVLMLFSVLPVTALADDSAPEAPQERVTSVPADSEDNAVHVTKTLSDDGKTLTLEAYATNTVSTHVSYEPLDIVLVLDVSGSMDWCVNCNATYGYYKGEGWKWSNSSDFCDGEPKPEYPPAGQAKDLNSGSETLYMYRNRKYEKVRWCDGEHGYYWQNHTPGWYSGDRHDNNHRVGDMETLYKKVTPEGNRHQHRIDALKTAVNTFINSVANQKDSEGNAIDNKISIVKFASSAEIVKPLTSASTNKTELQTAVTKLTTGGATRADDGMAKAKEVLDKRSGSDKSRKSVVIMFTDGTPTKRDTFDSEVASAAISTAYDLKNPTEEGTTATTVFTVGIFDGADPTKVPKTNPSNNSEKTNNYMHAVSSNYPAADFSYVRSWDGDWMWSFGDRANGNYYLAASSASELNAIFQAISQEIGSLNAKIDESSVLSDTLSQYFTFNIPEGAENNGVTVQKRALIGVKDGEFRWDEARDAGLTASINGKNVTVTGFDYGENAVTVKTDADGKETYSGCKLVVTIPIQPDTTCTGWREGTNNYDTNAAGAGLTYGEEKDPQKVTLPDSPEAPVTGYTVTYQYTGDKPNDQTEPEDTRAYITGQKATVQNAPESPVTDDDYTYTFGGWKIGSESAGTEIEITDHNVVVTGSWMKAANNIEVPFVKEWVNTPDTLNLPNSITVQLIDNNKDEQNQIVRTETFQTSNQDKAFENVPANGNYTVKEVAVAGTTLKTGTDNVFEIKDANGNVTGYWESEVVKQAGSGILRITNTYTPTTATVVITKELAGVPSGTEVPENLEIILTLGDTEYARKTADEDGDGATFTFTGLPAGTYEITEADYDIGGYDCTPPSAESVTVTESGYGSTITRTLTNTYTEEQNPGLSIEKIAYKTVDNEYNPIQISDVKVGEKINYRITVRNTGNTELSNVTIEDTFTGKGTLKLLEGYGEEAVTWGEDGEFTINVGTLAKDDDREFQFEYIVVTDDAQGDNPTIKNTAVAKVGDEEMDSGDTEVEVDPDKFDLWVKKQWEYSDGILPGNWSIEARLYADGELVDAAITISSDTHEHEVPVRNLPLWRTGEDGKAIVDDSGKKIPIAYTVKETAITYGETALTKVSGEDKFEVTDEHGNLTGYWNVTYPPMAGNQLQIANAYEGVTASESYTVTKKILDKNDEPVDTVNAEIGDEITFVVTITNTGTTSLDNVTLTENFLRANGTLDGVYDGRGDDTEKYQLDNDMKAELPAIARGGSATYYLKYTVHEDDGKLENSVTVSTGDVSGVSNTVYVNVDRGDVDGYHVTGVVEKIVRSDEGTYNKDGKTQNFKFVISADEDGKEELATVTVPFDHTVNAGKSASAAADLDFDISLNQYDDLETKTFGGKEYKVLYLTEIAGDDEKMTYMTKPITLYLCEEEFGPQALLAALFDLNTDGRTLYAYANPDEGEFASVTNIYNRKTEKPVKVGPQLNRDDHVAYIMGYPDGTVQPEGQITRAEACTIFFRLLTESSRDYYFAKTNDYTDVNAGDWFNNAISTLSNAGIVTGYNDGTFRPNQPITRGEMAKIIANFANLNKGTKSFTDLAGHWSKSYVELAAGNGWIAGYPDGSFRPDQKITRAETVTMINRVLERVPAKESRLLSRSIMLTFPDNNPGDWYYIAIQEASNSHEYRRSVYETAGDEMWTKLIENVDWTKLEK